jgi:hypothetical protein
MKDMESSRKTGGLVAEGIRVESIEIYRQGAKGARKTLHDRGCRSVERFADSAEEHAVSVGEEAVA